MNSEFFEKYFKGLSWTSREYLNTKWFERYIKKFKDQHQSAVDDDEYILGEATDIEMWLFVMEWSLSLRVTGTYNRRRDGWDQSDDRIRELTKRLNELKNDLNITENHIHSLLRERFKDKLEHLQKDHGLLNRPYSKSKDYDFWHKGYIFTISNGNRIVVFNQYSAAGD